MTFQTVVHTRRRRNKCSDFWSLNEEVIATPSSHNTGLGELDNNAICQELSKSAGRKRKLQSTYSDENRYLIAKYAKDHMVHHKLSFSKSLLRNITTCGQSTDKKLKNLMQGRPLMFWPIIDTTVKKFMVSLYKKWGHVSRSIAATTAMVLQSKIDDKSVKNVVVCGE